MRPVDLLSEPLTDAEIRILGVLVEKQLTTPQSYPLTEHALLTGCNQATNRDPVVDYDTSVVRPALIRLRERALARRVMRAGERADKHAHRLDEQPGLSATAPLAVLAVLLLRGAQTPGELRSRSQRLHPFTDATALDAALTALHDRGYAEPLPRRPGEKQLRWRHLLAGVDVEVATEPGHAPAQHAAVPDADRPSGRTLRELTDALEQLEHRVTTLERELGLSPGAHVHDPADEPEVTT